VHDYWTAVDLQPGDPAVISICWDDLSIAPRNWNIGLCDIRARLVRHIWHFRTVLVARNNEEREKEVYGELLNCIPGGWAVARTAGQNQFELKADNGPAWLDLATGQRISSHCIPAQPGVRSAIQAPTRDEAARGGTDDLCEETSGREGLTTGRHAAAYRANAQHCTQQQRVRRLYT